VMMRMASILTRGSRSWGLLSGRMFTYF